MMNNALHTHIIASRFGAPLLIESGGGLIVEITDGNTFGYRGNYLYDLVKSSVSAMRRISTSSSWNGIFLAHVKCERPCNARSGRGCGLLRRRASTTLGGMSCQSSTFCSRFYKARPANLGLPCRCPRAEPERGVG
jgi:hypothetical protein